MTLRRFGRWLRKLRTERGWTQTDVAVHLGMDRTFLSDLERGKREPCLRTLEVIAQGFEMTGAPVAFSNEKPSQASSQLPSDQGGIMPAGIFILPLSASYAAKLTRKK